MMLFRLFALRIDSLYSCKVFQWGIPVKYDWSAAVRIFTGMFCLNDFAMITVIQRLLERKCHMLLVRWLKI